LWGESTAFKSCVTAIQIKAFYAKTELCTVSDEHQKTFASETFLNAALIVWKDVEKQSGEDFPVSASRFRQFADGGAGMDANLKGLKNLGNVDIDGSHLIDANVPWSKIWPKAAKPTAMQNRIMQIPFVREVADDDINTRLVKNIMAAEVGPLLVLQVRAYQAVLKAAGDKTFSSLKIPYFQAIRVQADPLVRFITERGDYEEGAVTTVRQLKLSYNGEQTVTSWDAAAIKKTLEKLNTTLEDEQAYEYEEETRSHRFDCKHCQQDVGPGNGNDHSTGKFVGAWPVLCRAYNADTRPKTANVNKQTGVTPDTKTNKVRLTKALDSRIKNLNVA
jgi:hypothetical protein